MNKLILCLLLAASAAQAKTINDIPPGQLKKDIKALPAQARGKALGHLKNTPDADMKFMRAASSGDLFYADEMPVDQDTAAVDVGEDIDPEQVFKLHSRPGSQNVFFLDFDGMVIQGRDWNTNTCTGCVQKPIKVAMPYDPSRDGAAFNQEEMNLIHHIWQRVVDSYAGFDVDVTTEEPAVFTNTTGIALITEHLDTEGDCLSHCYANGVAYVDVFGTDRYHTRSPALVFAGKNTADGIVYSNPTWIAIVISHEFGHNVYLRHHGFYKDGQQYSYYGGHGVALISWGPTMGSSSTRSLNTWHTGAYLNDGTTTPNNAGQNDLAVLGSHLGYVVDTEPDNKTTATPMPSRGMINSADDVDWFYLDVAETSDVTITATPSWGLLDKRYYPHPYWRSARLDIELTLGSASVDAVFDNPKDTEAIGTIESAPAGRYYVGINGAGSEYYADYDSIGEYLLAAEVVPTTEPPPPEPPPEPPPPPEPQPELTYTTEKIHGSRFTLTLTWDGLEGAIVTVLRNGEGIATVDNTDPEDRSYSLQVRRKHKGHGFRVCDTDQCTNTIRLRF